MTEVRPLQEMYKMVIDRIIFVQNKFLTAESVCLSIKVLRNSDKISSYEYEILTNHFLKTYRRLNFIQRLRFGLGLIKKSHRQFWWKLNAKGTNQRIKYIEYLISKL
jgi:hypothetical protein